MKDFLEGVCEGSVMALVVVVSGMMAISPTMIALYFAYVKQSWLLGVLAGVVFVLSVGVGMAILERIRE